LTGRCEQRIEKLDVSVIRWLLGVPELFCAITLIHHTSLIPPSRQVDYNNMLIRSINVTTRSVSTLAGRRGLVSPFMDGIGTSATFNGPNDVALDEAGTLALVVRVMAVVGKGVGMGGGGGARFCY
jgi:hypothetical protein